MLANKRKALEEEIGQLEARANEILAAAEKEKRDTTATENTEFDELISKVEAKKKELETVKRQLDFQGKQAASVAGSATSPVSETDKRNLGKFSFIKAIRQLHGGGKFDGVEQEVISEGRREAAANNAEVSGITIPSSMVEWGKRSEKRDLTVTTEGTDLVQTTVGGLIPLLRPEPVVQSLGAQMLTGLVGDLSLPRHNAAASMAWEGENDANAETTPTFDKVNFTPNRVGGYTDLSQKLMRQSSLSMDNWLRGELETALALEIDSTAINGAGSGNQPEGILNITGIGDVATGTDGGAITYANAVLTRREVKIDNALRGSLAWLTNPLVEADMMIIPKQGSGVEGNFILNDPNSFMGYRFVTSNQVPSNLTKGSSSGVCSPLIFGNWNDLYIAQWGGVDLVIDPYTQATVALLRIVINAYMDVKVRHPESFAAIQDLTTT